MRTTLPTAKPSYSRARIEGDSAHSLFCKSGFIIRIVKFEIKRGRESNRPRIAGFSSIFLTLLTMAMPRMGPPALAQVLNPVIPHTSIVVFADHPMPSGRWNALFEALQSNLADNDEDIQALDRTAEFIRGDAVLPGLSVDSAIVVFLHGSCELEPQVRRTVLAGPLGWVYRRQGRIEPFVHVDCPRLGQVLGGQGLGVSRDRRTSMMADAMARVILHEWIHIATQCSAHAEQGIEKAEFGPADLLYGDHHPALSVRNR